MTIHLRQVCLVATQLAPVAEEISAIFSLPVCHVDPDVSRFGLENCLFAIGSNFLEVVAPIRADTAAQRFLDKRGGDGGYMVICQATTRAAQAALRARAVQQGVRIAFEADRGSWNIMQLHPGDMRAAFLEVDWDTAADATGNWEPAGGLTWKQAAMAGGSVSDIIAVELQGKDPLALAQRWAAVLDLPLDQRDNGIVISLANADLRFVHAQDERGDGLSALDLRVTDRERILDQAKRRGSFLSDRQVMVAGTRFNLVN